MNFSKKQISYIDENYIKRNVGFVISIFSLLFGIVMGWLIW